MSAGQIPTRQVSGLDEQIRDVVDALLVAGTNVTITPDDVGDTITISAASGSGGGSATKGVELSHSTTYTPATASTWFSHPFDTEIRDDATFHDPVTNNTRITILEPGWYALSGVVSFPATSTAGTRAVRFLVNGTTVIKTQVYVSMSSTLSPASNAYGTAHLHYFAAGDYVELQGFTTVTTAVNGAGLSSFAAVLIPGSGAVWTDFTPTLNNFPATVNFARYKITGKTCRVQVALTLTGVPTGRMEVVAPATALATLPTGNMGPVGTCIGNDVGTARRLGAAFFLAGNVIAFGSTDVTSFWGVSTPHVWASGDTLAFNAEFEMA